LTIEDLSSEKMDQTTQNPPPRYKIMIVGHHLVGKTSLFDKISKAEEDLNETEHNNHHHRVDRELIFRNERFGDKDVQFLIFDFRVTERPRNIMCNFSFCEGVIWIYDITSRISFEALEEFF